jgi:hypothetical protein
LDSKRRFLICALSEDVRTIRPPVSLRGGAAVIAAADWIGRDRVIERPSEGLNPWLIRTGKALECPLTRRLSLPPRGRSDRRAWRSTSRKAPICLECRQATSIPAIPVPRLSMRAALASGWTFPGMRR